MTKPQSTLSPGERLRELALRFKLPTVAAELERHLVATGHADALATLCEVFEMEGGSRQERRVARLRHASNLPPGKTLETLELSRFSTRLVHQVKELCRGEFAAAGDNVLVFGLPGTGKSHVAAAIGHKLVDSGRSVYYTPTLRMVQDLLRAKRDLTLHRLLRKLDNIDVLMLDDIGYVQQAADEVEVLFTLLAERYERRSLVVTSNLVFSQWDQIFKNPMTTAAAVDRMVHHATVLDFHDIPSYRAEEAARRKRKGAPLDGTPSTIPEVSTPA
jgi:DNA replication protein DnaC